MHSKLIRIYSCTRFGLIVILCMILMLGCAGKGGPTIPDPSGAGFLEGTDQSLNPPGTDRLAERPSYVEDEVLVVLNQQLQQQGISNLLNALPLHLKKTIPCRWGTVYELVITDGTPVEEMVHRLRGNPDVRFAEPNHVYYFAETPYWPNDPMWESDDPGTDPRDNIFDQWGPAKIGADIVWNDGAGSEDVVVAIIDTGIRSDHEDLNAVIWINEDEIPDNDIDDGDNGYIDDTWGWDTGSDDNDPWDDGWYGHYHGTACAGVAGAIKDNGVGLSGVAPGIRIMALKTSFDNELWESAVIEAVNYAVTNEADIISMSFGGITDSEIFHAALDDAWNDGHGLNLIACAQNYSSTMPHYPAAYDSVLCVGATIPFTQEGNPIDEKKITYDEDGYWWGTNYGDWLTVMGFGDKYMTTSGKGFNRYYDGLTDDFFGGTSCATPMAAGVMALIYSFHPGHSAGWYWTRLQDTADDLYSPGFDIYSGYGRCNALRAVYGSDRYSGDEDPLGFVPLTLPDAQIFDTIHDVPGNTYHDLEDLYRFIADIDGYLAIDLDIYTWGEDLDMALYSNEAMTDLVANSTGPNHYYSSFETIGMGNIHAGEEYFLRIFSPESGSSTIYGVEVRTFSNELVITGENLAPSFVYQTGDVLPFLKLNLEVGYQCTLDEIIISKSGSVPNSNLASVNLYRDSNGNDEFDGEDEFITKETASNTNRVRLDDLGITWTYEEPLVLFVGAEIDPSPEGSDIRLSLENYKDVSTEDGLEAHYTDFPIVSDLTELGVDNDPPYWTSTVGVQSADPGYGCATLGFNEAVDDLTPPVKYNVYYTDTLPFDIVTAYKSLDVITTPGSGTDLQAKVTGLLGEIEWHFVVRVEDQAGNEDENLVTQSCTPELGGDPYNPQIINEYIKGGEDLARHGDIIVTADHWGGMHVYHRIDMLNLELITTWNEGDYYTDIAYDGEYAYLTGLYGFSVVDMSDPYEPSLASYLEFDTDHVCLNGDWAYVDGGGGHTLFTLDISDPENIPVPYELITPQGYHKEMIVENNYLYLSHYEEGIMVFDITNPGYPIHVNSFGNLGNMRGLVIENDILYAYGRSGDLSTFDYSVSWTNPPWLDTNTDGDSYFAGGIVVIGDYAYVSESNYGVYVYDVSDPFDIILISDLVLNNANGMIHDGPVIYAVSDMRIHVIM